MKHAIHAIILAKLLLCLSASGAEPARVRASVIVGKCSGTVFLIDGDTAWGIGCSHCARVGSKVLLRSQSGWGEAVYVARDPATDLSLFKFPAKLVQGVARIPSPGQPDLKAGQQVTRIGYPSRKSGKIFRSRVLTYKKTHKIDGLTAPRACFKGSNSQGGESGCGLFVGDWLVGVLSHHNQCHAATLSQMQGFLTANAKRFGKSPFT